MNLTEEQVNVQVVEKVVPKPQEPSMLDKLKVINWLAVLVEKNNLSLGRVSFWVTFVVINYMWVSEKQVQESMLMVLMVLMSYNLGKKFTSIAETYFSKPKGSSDGEDKVQP